MLVCDIPSLCIFRELVGMMACTEYHTSLFCFALCVHPLYRGQKLSHRIMLEAAQYAHHHRKKAALSGTVEKSQSHLVAFYMKMGGTCESTGMLVHIQYDCVTHLRTGQGTLDALIVPHPFVLSKKVTISVLVLASRGIWRRCTTILYESNTSFWHTWCWIWNQQLEHWNEYGYYP